MSVCPGHGHNLDIFHVNPNACPEVLQEPPTMRERQDEAAKEAFGHGGVGYSSMHHALQDFIDKYLALEDRLAGVAALAEAWEARGEHDMRFSKTIPDEDIAVEILTGGAQMVENARHIRNALEGTT